MIARISGILITVKEDHALLEVNGITYTILITRAVGERLVFSGKIGQEVTFNTYHYIEGTMGMGNLIPRIVGFLNETDLEFFSMLITVQGLSVKKSLKALIIPVKDMARAIELGDTAALKKLPEIGGKTSQKIVMELQGKAAKFALLREEEIPSAGKFMTVEEEYQREAVEILRQLQYTDTDAEALVRRTMESRPDITAAEELIQVIFKNQINVQAKK